MLETMIAFVMTEHMGGLTFDPPIGRPAMRGMLAPDRRPHRIADGRVIPPYTDRRALKLFRIAADPDLAVIRGLPTPERSSQSRSRTTTLELSPNA